MMNAQIPQFSGRNAVAAVVAVSLASAILTGCVSVGPVAVESDVTRFHALPAKGEGQTFVVYPGDEKAFDSLAWKSAEAIAVKALEGYGWRRAVGTNQVNSDYIVVVAYGIDTGRVMNYSIPILGQTGGGGSTLSGSFNSFGSSGVRSGNYSGNVFTPPTFGQVGTAQGSTTVYRRVLFVDVYDREKQRAKDSTPKVFEGRLVSSGSSSQIEAVLSQLTTAMFTAFPGTSGVTKFYRVPMDTR